MFCRDDKKGERAEGRRGWDAVPNDGRGCLAIARHDIVGVDASLALGMTLWAWMPRYRSAGQGGGCRPEPPSCRPDRSEGSLGAYAPRDDRVRDVAPSTSERSLGAYTPRDDRVRDVAPSASEGSLGACVPRDDKKGERAEGRRGWDVVPNDGRGCLAIARHDKVEGAGRSKGLF